MPRKKESGLRYVGYVIVAALAAGIGYSVYYYLASTESVETYDVCTAAGCIRSFHVHADVSIMVCGEKVLLPLEAGPLESAHTHKERNVIHFHERLPYDRTTGRILDTTHLKLGTFMQNLEMRFNADCLGDHCSGDLCGDKPGIVRMSVNGQERTDFEQYVWSDGDHIELRFE